MATIQYHMVSSNESEYESNEIIRMYETKR